TWEYVVTQLRQSAVAADICQSTLSESEIIIYRKKDSGEVVPSSMKYGLTWSGMKSKF
ncbi:18807_t:CDS:2, partial [Racocetra persica]